jgi:hypothetical protein
MFLEKINKSWTRQYGTAGKPEYQPDAKNVPESDIGASRPAGIAYDAGSAIFQNMCSCPH